MMRFRDEGVTLEANSLLCLLPRPVQGLAATGHLELGFVSTRIGRVSGCRGCRGGRKACGRSRHVSEAREAERC